jgi:hypothetical protein
LLSGASNPCTTKARPQSEAAMKFKIILVVWLLLWLISLIGDDRNAGQKCQQDDVKTRLTRCCIVHGINVSSFCCPPSKLTTVSLGFDICFVHVLLQRHFRLRDFFKCVCFPINNLRSCILVCFTSNKKTTYTSRFGLRVKHRTERHDLRPKHASCTPGGPTRGESSSQQENSSSSA